jgi:hypothetical protein
MASQNYKLVNGPTQNGYITYQQMDVNIQTMETFTKRRQGYEAHNRRPAYWHPFCSEIMNPHIPAANTGAQLGQGLSNFRTGHKTLVFSNVTIPVQPSYLPNDPIFRASGDDSGHWWRMSQYDCSPRLEHYPNDKQWQVLGQDLVHLQFTSQRCCLWKSRLGCYPLVN